MSNPGSNSNANDSDREPHAPDSPDGRGGAHESLHSFSSSPSEKTGHDEASDPRLRIVDTSSATDAPHASSFSGQFGLEFLDDPPLPAATPGQPRAGVRVRRRRRLQLVAAEQHGCFTLAQAAAAGFDRRARHHHLSYGNWRRTDAPGVFRLTSWPADALERFRAWSLATGCSATSWTGLELAGLTVAGPRLPVQLAVPDNERRRVLLATSCSDPMRVELHRNCDAQTASVVIDSIPVRPPAESICVVIMSSKSRGAYLALADDLVDRGHLDVNDVFAAAVALSAGGVMNHFWARRQSGQRDSA